MLLLVLFLVDVASSTLNSLSWYAMPSSLISSSVICAGALMKAKPLNFPVLLFIGKSIFHVSRKQDVEFKHKSSQISCLAISSDNFFTNFLFQSVYNRNTTKCCVLIFAFSIL